MGRGPEGVEGMAGPCMVYPAGTGLGMADNGDGEGRHQGGMGGVGAGHLLEGKGRRQEGTAGDILAAAVGLAVADGVLGCH